MNGRRRAEAYLEGRRAGMRSAARTTLVSFLGGLVAGLALWDYEMRASRRHLFSRNPLKRLAALGYLGGSPSVETARLLRDYVNWESRPELRRRGLRLLRRIESALA